MERTKWFERKFPPITDNGLLPGIIERLEGTPARLYYKTGKLTPQQLAAGAGTKWSIKKEIGHLGDLEPLWLQRLEQLAAGDEILAPADLTNTKTHETAHDETPVDELLQHFFHQRLELVAKLRSICPEELEKTALHPRLKVPMRIIDLANFVAEHDDHHLAQITELLLQDTSWMEANTL
ncbi:MAG: DinB family protein [Chitinophagaceae bacterium]|nr:DinB family protein [Chitinophagaceae bacterium]